MLTGVSERHRAARLGASATRKGCVPVCVWARACWGWGWGDNRRRAPCTCFRSSTSRVSTKTSDASESLSFRLSRWGSPPVSWLLGAAAVEQTAGKTLSSQGASTQLTPLHGRGWGGLPDRVKCKTRLEAPGRT